MVSIITTRYKLEKDKDNEDLQYEIINQIIELSKRITDNDMQQIRVVIGVQRIERDDGEYY